MRNIPNKLKTFIKNKFPPKSIMQGLAIRLYMNYAKVDKSPKPHRDLLLTMNKGILVLEELGIKYSLGRGTLLGLHRDNKYTDGDNDIDIDIFSDKHVYEIISKMPFEILLITIAAGRYQQLVFVDSETGVLFDIWFYHFISNYYLNRHVQGFFKIPKNKVKNLSNIFIYDKNYSCFDTDWYCEYWYGKSWKIPKKYSKTWIEFYKNDCSGFDFEPELNVQYVKIYQQCF